MVKEAIIMPNTAEYPFSSAVRAGDSIFCRVMVGLWIKQGADAVISTASSQSNWCLQLAAAGRKLGMKASFVLKIFKNSSISVDKLINMC